MITRFAIIAPHQNYLHGFFGRILSVPLSIFQKTPPIYTRPLWLDTVSVGRCVCAVGTLCAFAFVVYRTVDIVHERSKNKFN